MDLLTNETNYDIISTSNDREETKMLYQNQFITIDARTQEVLSMMFLPELYEDRAIAIISGQNYVRDFCKENHSRFITMFFRTTIHTGINELLT